MKKILLAFIALSISVITISAQSRAIDEKALPQTAKTFLTTHFAGDKINIAMEEREGLGKEYKVILKSGITVEFDTKGEWTDVKSKGKDGLPKGIVSDKIEKYVKSKFPSNRIISIEQDKRGVEIKLNNGVELEFNTKGELVEIS